MRFSIVFLWIFLVLTAADAAEIELLPKQPGMPDFIVVYGVLNIDDIKTFQTKSSTSQKAIVIFAGPGGNLLAGLQIGEMIRLKNFETAVLKDDICASACALAWLGGARRLMGEKAKIGFHAARNNESGDVSGMGNAIVGAYLNKIGLPMAAVAYITKAAPENMTWLTVADANRCGIDVFVIADQEPSKKEAKEISRTNSINGPEGEARDFAYNHFAVESEPPEESLRDMATQLAETVSFYGKYISRQEVLDEHKQFVRRWPQRRYLLRSNALNVSCNQIDNTCLIDAIVDWVASSAARNAKSVGTSVWSASLQRMGKGSFVITSVNGKVLNRQLTPLVSGISASEK
jgi:ATP-dependent protease ClpP protease subunit